MQMKFAVTPYLKYDKLEKNQFRLPLQREMFFVSFYGWYCRNIGLCNRFYHFISMMILIEKISEIY